MNYKDLEQKQTKTAGNTPATPSLSSLEKLMERLWHFTSIGLGNCRAAQKIRNELSRQIFIQSALLANANFNPDEPRDPRGLWTTEGNATASTTNKPKITGLGIGAPASGHGAMSEPNQPLTNLSATVGDTLTGTPIKFGIGFEKGLQEVTSDIGQGWAQLSDPGPLKDDFKTHILAEKQALETVPNPHFDPLTGELTGANTYGQALFQMQQQREAQREDMRRPGESLSQASAELAQQLGVLQDATPGPKIVGTAGEKAGQVAGFMAPSAIPYVGWMTGAATAGLASAGSTFDQAFEIYKLAGYPEAQAREMARDVALRNGALSALIFALPVGKLAALPQTALARILAAAGISGTQLSLDTLQTALHAKATYNPNLTLRDIAQEAGLTFLYGATFGAATHGASEASKAGLRAPAPAAEPQEPLNHLENYDHTFPMSYSADDKETQAQIKSLQDWAKETGRLANYKAPAGSAEVGGAEHDVFKNPGTDRVEKVTTPGRFGFVMTEHGFEPANPSFYLRRIDLMNQVFGSDIRVEGVTPGRDASIITSQPFHEADPKLEAQGLSDKPSFSEIANFMRSRGFEPRSGPLGGWIRSADGVMAFDAKPDNFIKTEKGLEPVDLILQKGPLLP